MKTLGLVLLWIAAAAVALLLLLRWRRGRPLVLTGTLTPRLARMVVVLLVALGVDAHSAALAEEGPAGNAAGQGAAPAQPPGVPALEAPADLDAGFIGRWRRKSGQAKTVVSELTKDAVPTDTRAAAKFLASYKQWAIYSPALAEWLWQSTANHPAPATPEDIKAMVALYTGLRTYTRMADALTKAAAVVKPLDLPPRPWLSKGGGREPNTRREREDQARLLTAARAAYPTLATGPWEREGATALRIVAGRGVVLHHQGRASTLGESNGLAMRRLDVLTVPTTNAIVLEHAWLGQIALPQGRTFRVWDLPSVLHEAHNTAIASRLERALAGDDRAARELESALVFTHRAVREALAKHPEAAGAARLRMILAPYGT